MMGLHGIAMTIMLMLSPSSTSAFCLVPTTTARTSIDSFPAKSTSWNGGSFTTKPMRSLFATSDETSDSTTSIRTVDKLLERVETKDGDVESVDKEKIRELIATLSSDADQYVWDEKSSSSLFEPLIGYYNVSCTLTDKPDDNPVGGKWTRGLWTVKRTMQHVLPPLPVQRVPDKNVTELDGSQDEPQSVLVAGDAVSALAVAQVINAIRLELLWGFVNIWVLLRGDAVPLKLDENIPIKDENDSKDNSKRRRSPSKLLPNLSDRTVKAYFDRPKIGVSLQGKKKSNPLWKRVVTLGPTSAVVLDTPYADTRIRLGKGGTSGSQFVFRRLPEIDEEAREGWKWVLEKTATASSQMLTKKKLLLRVGILGVAFGILSRVLQQRWMKVGAGVSAVLSGISMIGVLRSTGGIESEGDTYMKGRE